MQENNLKIDNSKKIFKYLVKYLWKDAIIIICSIISLSFVVNSANMVKSLSSLIYLFNMLNINFELDLSAIQPLFYIALFLSVLSLNLCLNVIMKRFKASKDKFEKLIYIIIVLISIIYCVIIII